MNISFHNLGLQPYNMVLDRMQKFAASRTPDTLDEIWYLEHLPVFTLGQAGKKHHIIDPKHIPIIHSDRGGQVTYHGPGQLIAYTMIDIRRRQINIKNYVFRLEQAIINLLNSYGIEANRKINAPGVYIFDKKICSLGIRIKHGTTYHGLSLNVDMDLNPFKQINPCGIKDLQVTQICEFVPNIKVKQVINDLQYFLNEQLSINLPLAV